MADKTVKYVGSPGFSIQGLGNLEPDAEYDVPAEQADELVAGPHFEPVGWKVKAPKAAAADKEDDDEPS
jgi:hypothetical protein